MCVCVYMRARVCTCVRMRINEHAHRQNFLCNTTWVSSIIAKNPVNIQKQVSSISRLSHLNPLLPPSKFFLNSFSSQFRRQTQTRSQFYIHLCLYTYIRTCMHIYMYSGYWKVFLNSIKKQSEFIFTRTRVCIYTYVCICVYIHVQWILEKTPALSLEASAIITTLGWNNIGR